MEIILLIIAIIFFYVTLGTQYESFTNFKKPIIINPRKKHLPDQPYIWTYNDKSIQNGYMQLCHETLVKKCANNFNIVVLNKKTLNNYLPDLRKDLNEKVTNIDMKIDYYKYNLLYKYGGIWIDFNTIVMKNPISIIDKLKKYDYIGFDSFYNTNGFSSKGYSNKIMIGQKGNILFRKCIEACNNLLDTKPVSYFEDNNDIFGQNLLPMTIKHCQESVPGWRYYHFPSKCLERDSHGEKLRNHVLISNREIDDVCRDSYYFVPIYNTAPGFPKWFKDLTKTGIIKSNTLISRLFKLALGL